MRDGESMRKTLKNIVPAAHLYVRESVLEKGNVAGVKKNRTAWAKDLKFSDNAEYTFFAGCGYHSMRYLEGMAKGAKAMKWAGIDVDQSIDLNRGMGRFFNRFGIDIPGLAGSLLAESKKDLYTGVLTCAVHVLQNIGIELGYLFEKEPCCGSPLYYSGFLDDYAENANRVCDLFKKVGVRKVIGLLPGCTASLKNLYPKVIKEYDLEVYHFSEIVAAAIREKRITPKLKEKLVVTYHDPCQLSRYLDLTKEPREILRSIANLELREAQADRSGQWSTCCGGGGLEGSSPELSERMGLRRAEELLRAGADVIVTHCPACIMQLRRSVEKMKAKTKVLDLVEIIHQALPNWRTSLRI